MNVTERINALDWDTINGELHQRGYSVINSVLPVESCQELIKCFGQTDRFRKTVVMARHGYGQGEYKYFNYPLPELVQAMRQQIYPHLVPVANQWMQLLNIDISYPDTLTALHALCHRSHQNQPTPLLLKYQAGGYNTLHQDLYGEVYFPFQLAIVLDTAGEDYSGGEFVITQQKPRAQSRAIVLNPGRGDMIIFTTNFRPVKGQRGYYRATMRHGVSEVLQGERHTLGIIFHDAEK